MILVVFSLDMHVTAVSSCDNKGYSIANLIEPDYSVMPREESVSFLFLRNVINSMMLINC